MAKKKINILPEEKDSAFLLKIVMYIILASVWIKFQEPLDLFVVGISGVPIGLFVGLIVARQDRFQIDRKIEYVVLIVMTIVTYFIPAGIVI
ncbi:hypothetical protein HY004_00115 [Candidatus Saccharibacteria bacterium]|nr:hypothetical protein [Candidatus Saccharibacteria bacterium]